MEDNRHQEFRSQHDWERLPAVRYLGFDFTMVTPLGPNMPTNGAAWRRTDGGFTHQIECFLGHQSLSFLLLTVQGVGVPICLQCCIHIRRICVRRRRQAEEYYYSFKSKSITSNLAKKESKCLTHEIRRRKSADFTDNAEEKEQHKGRIRPKEEKQPLLLEKQQVEGICFEDLEERES